MPEMHATKAETALPTWVPASARHYLAHTETGRSIRSLARAQKCHPSTILRQVRKFENKRDDPLVDDALNHLSTMLHSSKGGLNLCTKSLNSEIDGDSASLTDEKIASEAKRILSRLCESGAVLAVARDMETAVVVRETEDGGSLRTAVIDRRIAQAIALKEWITCADPSARIARYVITNAGRAMIRELLARDENRAVGLSDSRAIFTPKSDWFSAEMDLNGAGLSSRKTLVESPLVGLSRRREKSGEPFLKKELIAAGERLREDFELARMDRQVGKNIAEFLADTASADATIGSQQGLIRAQEALQEIGPGLADVAYQCCCLLEGLEQTEKAMGWSARSGKIVLRIALERLALHYEKVGKFAPLIG